MEKATESSDSYRPRDKEAWSRISAGNLMGNCTSSRVSGEVYANLTERLREPRSGSEPMATNRRRRGVAKARGEFYSGDSPKPPENIVANFKQRSQASFIALTCPPCRRYLGCRDGGRCLH